MQLADPTAHPLLHVIMHMHMHGSLTLNDVYKERFATTRRFLAVKFEAEPGGKYIDLQESK